MTSEDLSCARMIKQFSRIGVGTIELSAVQRSSPAVDGTFRAAALAKSSIFPMADFRTVWPNYHTKNVIRGYNIELAESRLGILGEP